MPSTANRHGVTTVAIHNTRDGFAIGIIAEGERFAVIRADDRSRYVTIGRADTEDQARELANAEWLSDMGR